MRQRIAATKTTVTSTFVVLLIAGLLSTNASATSEQVLHNFTGGADGGYALRSLIQDKSGNLYGTAYFGGTYGAGAVFELSPAQGSWSQTVLYNFTGGADGANPATPLVFDSAGSLYGTTDSGGANSKGTVFELSPSEAGGWTETVLYSFCAQPGCSDGSYPASGVVMDNSGNLYGATGNGVFELTHSGSGWTETLLYSGQTYFGVTLDSAGNLYGAALGGYNGFVFQLSPVQGGGWKESTIYTFKGGKDGRLPQGGVILDASGSIYGTTGYGGPSNKGTVYKLTHRKNGWYETRLQTFGSSKNSPVTPEGELTFDTDGNIYGATIYGGTANAGTIFKLTASNSFFKASVLWDFSGSNGANPAAGVTVDKAGNVYGTTCEGGLNGHGVVFEVTQ
jgi:uncharacterized repeat protein (TIGR03803 family)